MNQRTLLLSLLLLPALPAQELRKGLQNADLVVVGRQVQKREHDADLTLHTVQVVRQVTAGAAPAAITVLDWPRLTLHQRPTPRQTRLYCLLDVTATANRLGLPQDQGPYYKMVGFAGSNPLVGAEVDKDPAVRLAAILASAAAGSVPPATTAAALADLALLGPAGIRSEATRLLAERPDLRTQLTTAHWSQLAARAGGESEDVPWKIALAEVCAEQRLPGLLDSLVVSLGPVKDPDYARCVGRIAAVLHGDDATPQFVSRLQRARDPTDRQMLLLALGASNTESALRALLQMRQTGGKDAAVDAALREHHSPRAKEAVFDKGDGKEPPK
jgi:hypothetical protein